MTHTLEALEPRRMLAVDLTYNLAFSKPTRSTVVAGGKMEMIQQVTNAADSPATGAIFVQYRLIPLGAAQHPTPPGLPDFYHPRAIVLANHLITDDLNPGGIGIQVKQELAFATTIPQGRYAVMTFLDSTNVYHETDESNNYRSWGTTRVISADGIAVIEATAGADTITIDGEPTGRMVVLAVNGVTEVLTAEFGVNGLHVYGGAGNDRVVATGVVTQLKIDGGDGTTRSSAATPTTSSSAARARTSSKAAWATTASTAIAATTNCSAAPAPTGSTGTRATTSSTAARATTAPTAAPAPTPSTVPAAMTASSRATPRSTNSSAARAPTRRSVM